MYVAHISIGFNYFNPSVLTPGIAEVLMAHSYDCCRPEIIIGSGISDFEFNVKTGTILKKLGQWPQNIFFRLLASCNEKNETHLNF